MQHVFSDAFCGQISNGTLLLNVRGGPFSLELNKKTQSYLFSNIFLHEGSEDEAWLEGTTPLALIDFITK